MVDINNNEENTQIQLHMDPKIEFKYRDLFNLHVGAEDVVIEFGNILRNNNKQGAIKDVIVMSPANAIRLQQALTQSIKNIQDRIKEMQEQQNNN